MLLAQRLELVEILRPRVDRGVAPGGKRLRRRLNGRVHVVGGGERRAADDVADGGVVYVKKIGSPGLDPAATDEVVQRAYVRTLCDRHDGLLGKSPLYGAATAAGGPAWLRAPSPLPMWAGPA